VTAPDQPSVDEPGPGLSKARLSMGMLGLATVGLVVPAIVIGLAYKSCIGTTTRGSVSVRGDGAEWRGALGACVADTSALTVVLGPPDAPALATVTLDPLDGPQIALDVPDRAGYVLTSASCPGLRVDVRRTGQRADGTQILDGAASASCRLPSGAQIDLDAWWRGCHQRDER